MNDVIEAGYAERLERNFYSRTNEKEIACALLERMLGDRRFAHSLDVGPGPGVLTEVLAKQSASLTLVEPNDAYEETLRTRFPDARLLLAPIEDARLADDLDLILLSHVLYYLPAERWLPLCRRLAAALRPNGTLIVIMNAPAGDWWRVVQTFRTAMQFHFEPLPALADELRDLGDTEIAEYGFETRYEDARTMAVAFGEQILQIVDPPTLERERQRFVALAEEICAEAGEPVLVNRAQVLSLQRR